MNNITFTAPPMTKPDDLSLKASLAWDYYFDKGDWFCAETGDGGIIVTDESRDLSNAFVLPDYVSLLEWLESYSESMLENDPADYFRACGAIPDVLLSDGVVQALIAAVNAPESPDAPPVSAAEKPEPPAAVPEPELQEYYVTFNVNGVYSAYVEAADPDSAKAIAQSILDREEIVFSDIYYLSGDILSVEDSRGTIVYDHRTEK